MSENTNEAEAKAKAEDLQKRVEDFNGELIPLLGKYELGLVGVPFITPDGRIVARPQVFDDRKVPETDSQGSESAPAEEKGAESLTAAE
jgi:hypothetical protein